MHKRKCVRKVKKLHKELVFTGYSNVFSRTPQWRYYRDVEADSTVGVADVAATAGVVGTDDAPCAGSVLVVGGINSSGGASGDGGGSNMDVEDSSSSNDDDDDEPFNREDELATGTVLGRKDVRKEGGGDGDGDSGAGVTVARMT